MFDHIKKHQELQKSRVEDALSKGEGARGGRVIGHTTSGKPIYETFNHPEHKGFTPQDHTDAADKHHELAQTAGHHRPYQAGERNKHYEASITKPTETDHSKMSNTDLHKLADKKAGSDRMKAIQELAKRKGATSMQGLDRKEPFVTKSEETNLEKAKVSKPLDPDAGYVDPFNDPKEEKKETKPKEKKADDKNKIIGKTKSGKEILSHTDPSEYKDFDAQDHRDAGDAHHTAASKGDGAFPGHHRAMRNKHTDEAIKGGQKAEKDKLKAMPGAGDRITNHEGVGGDVKHRDDTHTYIEHTLEDKTTKVSKIKNEDLDNKIAAGKYTHHKQANMKKGEDTDLAKIETNLDEAFDELEKGSKGGGAPEGTIKQMGPNMMIKRGGVWKYHAKGTGSAAPAPHHDTHHHAPPVLSHSEHAAAQSLKEESDKIAKEKMGDPKKRFKALAMFTRQVINGSSKSAIAYGTGGVGKTYKVTETLDAAGKVPFDEDEHSPGDEEYDYVKITGKMTAPQVYKALYQHNGKILLFDDCDSVLRDGNAMNLFKGALDTSGDGTVAYGTSGGVKDDEGESLPKRFKFSGSCIFISNLPSDAIHQALKSRSLKIDLTMDKQQTIDYIKEIATDAKGKYQNLKFKGIDKYSHQDLSDVIDYIDKHKDHIGDMNVRTIGKMLSIKQEADKMGEGKDWESYADQELFSKGEETDFFNGGIMKANMSRVESMYKSKSIKGRDFKQGDVTSKIHIQLSDEQMKEGGLDEEDENKEVKKSDPFSALIK